jgi:phage gp45-like
MHRATPANTSFRSYVSGGARATVNTIDDSKLMQEHASNFLINEARSAIESPQNYGFTSVAAAATKDATGAVTGCAETFISFMGGNRSFPVAGNMDDRRHRLMNLLSGDVAMFRQATDKLQFHLNTSGGFLTGPRDKTLRMQLLDEDSGQQQQQPGQQQQQPGQQQPGQQDTTSTGSSSSTGSQSGGQQQRGQQAVYSKAQSSYRFVDVTKQTSRISNNEVHLMLADGKTYVHCNTDKQVYVGAQKGKAQFDYLVTTSGPCINSQGKIG